MELGIFSKTFLRPSVEAVFDAVRDCGFTQVQFNMASCGLPSLPEHIAAETARHVARQAALRQVRLAAVSGTFNMIHPDPEQRRRGLAKLRVLAAACREMGASVITLCSGTRDPHDMWRRHPGNDDAAAWQDLLQSMVAALDIAEQHGITLAVEPEMSNVVSSAAKAERLLREMGSDRLKIVMDAANLFDAASAANMRDVMEEAFFLLGDHIAIAHAKDVAVRGGELEFVAAGKGELDYGVYLQLLRAHRYEGALILHGLAEHEAAGSRRYVQQVCAESGEQAEVGE